MRIRLSQLNIESRLVGLIVAETLLLNPFLLCMIFYFPGYLFFLHYFEGGIYMKPIGGFIILLAVAVAWKKIRSGSDAPAYDPPFRARVEEYPAVQSLVRKIEAALGTTLSDRMNLILSPVLWRTFGCDTVRLLESRNEITIPIGCLGIWSVFDLSCYLAHSVLRRRPPRWIFSPARNSLERLGSEQYQAAVNRISTRHTRMVERFADRYRNLVSTWYFLADVEADRRIADMYGAPTVADWLQRTGLADVSVPDCLTNIIEPAARRGQLLPIAESCRAYHHQIEPQWREALSTQMGIAERGDPNAGTSPLLIRLAALQGHPQSRHSHDPRMAATLFADLPSLEDEVLRNELGELVQRCRRATVEDLGISVLILQMEEEVARNAELLEGRSACDIPALLANVPMLAASYREDPRYLFAQVQRESMVPYLLSAFLATELVREGWSVLYSIEDGLQLQNGRTRVSPGGVISGLIAGEISGDEFQSLLRLTGPFSRAADTGELGRSRGPSAS